MPFGGGRAASLERPVSAMAFGGGRSVVVDPENNHVQIVSFGKEGNGNVVKSATMSPTHYAVPRGGGAGSAGGSLWLPDFNQEKTDMVIPQPVYMNSSDAVRMKVQGVSEVHDEDDLKTPTVEELTFPGHKAHNPPLVQMMSTSTDGDGGSSTSSSGSIGSSEQSSGYGSQNAIVKPFNNDAGGGGGGGGVSERARNSNAAAARVAIKPLQKSEPPGK